MRDGLKYRRHRLCEHLATDPRTNRVWYVAPHSVSLRQFGRSMHEFRRDSGAVANGVHQVLIPDRGNQVRYGGVFAWIAAARLRRILSNGRRRVLWYTNPSFAMLCKAMAWDQVVYDCSDLWNRDGVQDRKLASEKSIVTNSHAVFASSEHLKERLASFGGPPARVVENGVDYEHFQQADAVALEGLPRPRLGFVGGLKFKIDYDLIAHTADQFREASVVLIGPVDASQREATDRLRSRPNVHFLKAMGYEQVPGHIRALDVGLLPYKSMEYNHAVSPLKLFEYLAAGVPAVGTGLPTTSKYQMEGVYYYSENDYGRFVEQCRQAVKGAHDESLRRARQGVARQQDWAQKFRYMLDTVNGESAG